MELNNVSYSVLTQPSIDPLPLKRYGTEGGAPPHTPAARLVRAEREVGDDLAVGCGVTKGCFNQTNGLATYAMTTGPDGRQYLQVQMQAGQGYDWIALGFGTRHSMASCVLNFHSNL